MYLNTQNLVQMEYENLFIICLAITILIETFVLFFMIRIVFKFENIDTKEILFTCVFASFSTLPYLWYFLPNLVDDKLLYIFIGEISAVIIEAFIISKFLKIRMKYAIYSSFFCNLISFSIGIIFI